MNMESNRGAWSQALLLAAVGGWVMLLQWQTSVDPALREAAAVAMPEVEMPLYPAPKVDESAAAGESAAPTF